MGAAIFIGTMSVCACAGLLIGAMLGANRRAKDLEDLDRHWLGKFKLSDKLNVEDVARLKAEHAKELIRARAKRKL